MKIPACFYGRKPEARRECNKVASKLLKGVPLIEAVAGYDLIDTKDVPEAPLMVRDPYGIIDSAPFFYMSLIQDAIVIKFHNKYFKVDRMDADERLFNQLIEYDWSILAFCDNPSWVTADSIRKQDCRHRWQPYLRKLCEFWNILNGEGKRYVGKGGTLGTLWETNRTMKHILGKMGVSRKDALEPHDPANLQGLCEKYNLLTMDVLNDPKILAINPYED